MSHVLAFALTFACNALWQVPLLLLVGLLGARLLRDAAPMATYRLWSAVLALQVGLPLTCAAMAESQPQLRTAWWSLFRHGHGSGGVTIGFGPGVTTGAPGFVAPLLLWLGVAYGGVVLMFAVRLLRAMVRTQGLRRGAVMPRLSPESLAAWERCRTTVAKRPVVLRESNAAATPLVLGAWQPCVLLPADLASTVSPREWAALLAHECAHVARQDFAKNLLWELVTLPLAWHPALTRTRAALAESREAVCDAVAARQVGTPVDYARALVQLATRLLPVPPAVPLHAIGMLDANALERRVMRLLTTTDKAEGWVRRAGRWVACGVLAGATCASAWAWRSTVTVPAAAQSSGQQPKTPQISGAVMAGQRLGGENPEYPGEAKASGIEGTVQLSATISEEGTIENLEVVSGPDELRQAAVDAVKTWRYKPYLLNGDPTAVQTTINVNFHLN